MAVLAVTSPSLYIDGAHGGQGRARAESRTDRVGVGREGKRGGAVAPRDPEEKLADVWP